MRIASSTRSRDERLALSSLSTSGIKPGLQCLSASSLEALLDEPGRCDEKLGTRSDDAPARPMGASSPPTDLPPLMGEELRKARERAGLTQEQLSLQAGLSRPYISQLERGLKSPTVDTLFRLSDALDVWAADLVRRVDAARKRKPG